VFGRDEPVALSVIPSLDDAGLHSMHPGPESIVQARQVTLVGREMASNQTLEHCARRELMAGRSAIIRSNKDRASP
jgi:hypothetical protein